MTHPSEVKTSPMMVQWKQCKVIAKDAILLFRLGDFYEAFYEDAHLLSKELDLTLTKRQDVPMSGMPWHSADGYIDKLVAKGYKIAVAEQTEDPKKTKGLVAREVKRFITPGTNLNTSYLSDKTNNYTASLCQVGDLFGLSFADLSTGECKAIELQDLKSVLSELCRLSPAEIILPQKFQRKHSTFLTEMKLQLPCLINALDDWYFEYKLSTEFLMSHLNVQSLDGFGLKNMIAAVNAAGSLLHFLKESLCQSIAHINAVQPYFSSEYMTIDPSTLYHLELTESIRDHSRKNTLLEHLDKTETPMGARALKRLIVQPLLKISEIHLRQGAVEEFLTKKSSMEALSASLAGVKDLERLMTRIATGIASPRDLMFLKISLDPLPQIKLTLKDFSSILLEEKNAEINDIQELTGLIGKALVDEPPLRITEGRTFKEGYSEALDELYQISQSSKDWMANYQKELREQTDIKTLKVGYTRVSGFYIEVSKGQAIKVPDNFIRRQTLTNAERYMTAPLKEFEEKVLQSEERIANLETTLFGDLLKRAGTYFNTVMSSAKALAIVDVLLALAKVARANNYTKPLVDESGILDIKDGRHPVIESLILREKFIPNDTFLDGESEKMMVITGPNMAGKSTYIRQVALIVILAQIGSFVPASYSRIGIIDKLFTRIGASDDLSKGQSTFMVEMMEAANILNNATSRSLVILDEIGRGTSTYDGISIAWSIAEYLLTTPEKIAKTLFATHYFELTKLEEKVPGALNYTVAVHESGDQILFLRKIIRGKANRSYGIQVAKLAGLPLPVILRSKEILSHLEEGGKDKHAFDPTLRPRRPAAPKGKFTANEFQLTFFGGE